MFGLAQDPEVGFVGSQCGGFVFPHFMSAFDAAMSLGMLLRMLVSEQRSLDAVAAGLPPCNLRTESVFCRSDQKGAVMRAMVEDSAGERTELTEGVKVWHGDSWALVLPHPAEPAVKLYAEGSSAEETQRLLDRYRYLVEGAAAEGQQSAQ